MEIKIRHSKDDYFVKLLYLLRSIPPFNRLTDSDIAVYAILLKYNERYLVVPMPQRNKLIFEHDVYVAISDELGIQMARVYNIVASLRRKGIIGKEGLIPQYVLNREKDLVFHFEESDDE